MEVVYDGKILVREEKQMLKSDTNYNRNISGSSSNSLSVITSYSYKFKPSYRVNNLVEDSPAAKAGVEKNDILLKINGQEAYQLSLNEVIGKLREKNGKRIKLLIQRKGVYKKIDFKLKRRL